MTFSIVISRITVRLTCATLASLATLRPLDTWEVWSSTTTRPTRRARSWKTRRQGFPRRCAISSSGSRAQSALNAGIRLAQGDIIVTTDDDVRVEPDWLARAAAALERLDCDYVGGRVLPIWGGTRPYWLPDHGGKHWAVIALLDYGAEPIAFGARVPLGVNMAFRRTAFDRAGLFDPGTGRKAGTLLGQEVREWCIRARAAGVRGFYAPEMSVRHVIPASRLNKRYFRRWFYWRGISRARLYEKAGLDMEAPEQTVLDFATVPRVRRPLLPVIARPRQAARPACARHAVTGWRRSITNCGCGFRRHRHRAVEGPARRQTGGCSIRP